MKTEKDLSPSNPPSGDEALRSAGQTVAQERAVQRWTPGPWAQSHRQHSGGGYNTEVYDSAGETIAILAWHQPHKSKGVTATDRPYNANLIAAAPDLYEALEAYVEHFGDPLKIARAALAKARGEAIPPSSGGTYARNV